MQSSGTVRASMGEGVKPVDDPAARLLVKEAHSRMYRWPAGFGGYRAKLSLNDEGLLLSGRVTLVPRKDTVVELQGGATPGSKSGYESGSGPRECIWPTRHLKKVTGSMCCRSIRKTIQTSLILGAAESC